MKTIKYNIYSIDNFYCAIVDAESFILDDQDKIVQSLLYVHRPTLSEVIFVTQKNRFCKISSYDKDVSLDAILCVSYHMLRGKKGEIEIHTQDKGVLYKAGIDENKNSYVQIPLIKNTYRTQILSEKGNHYLVMVGNERKIVSPLDVKSHTREEIEKEAGELIATFNAGDIVFYSNEGEDECLYIYKKERGSFNLAAIDIKGAIAYGVLFCEKGRMKKIVLPNARKVDMAMKKSMAGVKYVFYSAKVHCESIANTYTFL